MRIPSLMIWGNPCLSKTAFPGWKRCCTSGQIPAAPAVVLAVPSPLGAAEHPFSSLQEPVLVPGTRHPSVCLWLLCLESWEAQARGGRDVQKERKAQGRVALLAYLAEGVFVVELPIFRFYTLPLSPLLWAELLPLIASLLYSVIMKDAVLTSPCFGFAYHAKWGFLGKEHQSWQDPRLQG